ncbi:hypothetical protein DIURU_003571 [Diutina rugosa]|uniref:Nucleoporin Nup54 alpha-helical domain-containing protein n=1 Tax=Diutina rugosa TaxID=5481 RepID=A0A642ULG8_DIURU|nr:uncharacterized protein DIURU_003571 [Diutina rugosa]KAA8901201.1 hypothetical protein DIURU_003571 [Diutina rugosa]
MFGNNAGANTGFSFGGTSNAQNTNTGGNLFGSKPAGQTGGLFGGNNQTQNSGGGLFGNNANQTQNNTSTTGGGLFSNNNNNQAKPAGNLFGSNTQSTGGGLFGNNNANNTANNTTNSGGLFGNNNTNTSGGLFGNKPAAPATSGGLFGNNTANTANNTATNTSGGLFGNKPATTTTSGGLFGNNNANNTQSGTTSGGLFGNNNNNNTTTNTANTSGGLFGSKPATTTTGGGLFGNNNSNTSSTTGGGLFGNNNANSSTTTSGGLFGNKPATTTTGGGLFGGNTNTASSGGLFGSKPATTTTTLGGQQPAQQQSSGLFGNQNKNSAAPSFAWTQPPAAAQPTATATTTAPQVVHTYTPAIRDQLEKIKEQWDPSSPKCALKTHFYNMCTNDQELALRMQRPPNELPEDWDDAMHHRPSDHSYPVKVTSIAEVAQRIEAQLEHVTRSRLILQQLNAKQEQLSSKHDLDNATRIQKARARHTTLSRRLLRLATVLAILKLKGYPLLPEEEEISKQFDTLNAKFTDPNSPMAKLSDISARLVLLKDRANDLNDQLTAQLNETSTGLDRNGVKKDEVATDEIIAKISNVLLQQQVGLNYLNEVVEKDTATVDKKIKAK